MKTSSKDIDQPTKDQDKPDKNVKKLKGRARSLANLVPAKKGQVLNPKGENQRIKDTRYIRSELQRILRTPSDEEPNQTKLESFLLNMIDKGHHNPNYARMTLEYTFGKPAQEVNVRDLTLEDIFSKALKQFDKAEVIDVDSEDVK